MIQRQKPPDAYQRAASDVSVTAAFLRLRAAADAHELLQHMMTVSALVRMKRLTPGGGANILNRLAARWRS